MRAPWTLGHGRSACRPRPSGTTFDSCLPGSHEGGEGALANACGSRIADMACRQQHVASACTGPACSAATARRICCAHLPPNPNAARHAYTAPRHDHHVRVQHPALQGWSSAASPGADQRLGADGAADAWACRRLGGGTCVNV